MPGCGAGMMAIEREQIRAVGNGRLSIQRLDRVSRANESETAVFSSRPLRCLRELCHFECLL